MNLNNTHMNILVCLVVIASTGLLHAYVSDSAIGGLMLMLSVAAGVVALLSLIGIVSNPPPSGSMSPKAKTRSLAQILEERRDAIGQELPDEGRHYLEGKASDLSPQTIENVVPILERVRRQKGEVSP